MTEQELRALVRQVISRHDSGVATPSGAGSGPAEAGQYVTPLDRYAARNANSVLVARPHSGPAARSAAEDAVNQPEALSEYQGQRPWLVQQHASHAMFVLPAGADTDGPCIIEPAVSCTHCGYCKSYGH